MRTHKRTQRARAHASKAAQQIQTRKRTHYWVDGLRARVCVCSMDFHALLLRTTLHTQHHPRHKPKRQWVDIGVFAREKFYTAKDVIVWLHGFHRIVVYIVMIEVLSNANKHTHTQKTHTIAHGLHIIYKCVNDILESDFRRWTPCVLPSPLPSLPHRVINCIPINSISEPSIYTHAAHTNSVGRSICACIHPCASLLPAAAVALRLRHRQSPIPTPRIRICM